MENLFQIINLLPFSFNWLDFVLLLLFVFYAIEGYHLGLVKATIDLVSFLLSFVVGLKAYGFLGSFISEIFSMPLGFANALSFFIASFLTEVVIHSLLQKSAGIFSKIVVYPGVKKSEDDTNSLKKVNSVLGVAPGLASSYILLTFLLTVVVSLPVSSVLKQTVFSSAIGSMIVANSLGFEKKLGEVFGGAVSETLNFFTVDPKTDEFVKLKFSTTKVTVDETSEQEMFEMVNKERVSHGLKPLTITLRLVELSRAHSRDMFGRGYFSHFTPDDLSPFDRMEQRNIAYRVAGENLALAPNAKLAMQGLMQSKGHRDNILSAEFGRIGIGVIDGGIYGKMFTQEFTD